MKWGTFLFAIARSFLEIHSSTDWGNSDSRLRVVRIVAGSKSAGIHGQVSGRPNHYRLVARDSRSIERGAAGNNKNFGLPT